MAVSLQQFHRNDDAWRQGRLWSRPVDLPEEDASLSLCSKHRAMQLKRSDFFEWPKDKELPPDTHFGLLTEVLERSEWCVFCELIGKSVSHTSYAASAEVLGCWIVDGIREGSNTVSLRLRIIPEMMFPEDAFTPFDIVPLGKDGSDSELFSGRKMQVDQIDPALLQGWVTECQNNHGMECTSTTSSSTLTPLAELRFSPFIRLLDLEEDCLVELNVVALHGYVALSYVWGSQPVFKTLNNNIEILKRSGELSRHCYLFPKSIQDAMLLTSSLKYRYLWIDSLCIIQDNKADKNKQLGAMDDIYSKAAFTIVAAGGDDANAGLSGLRPGSRRIFQNAAVYSPDLTLIALQPDCQIALETTTWNTRGWTYQERLLSRRYLFFLNNTVYFQCQKATWGEDYHAECQDVLQVAPMMEVVLSRSWRPPRMTRRTRYRLEIGTGVGMTEPQQLQKEVFPIYCRVIAEYTARNMSYPTDRLNGIHGVLNVLTQHCSFDFTHGLPEPLLEAAMLWRPQHGLTRTPDNSQTGKPYWPSWSWAGWIGGVEYDREDDFNGQRPLASGSGRIRATTKLTPCYLEPSNPANSMVSTTTIKGENTSIFVDGIHINTKVAKFRLTLFDRSGHGDDPPGLYRFGISCSTSGPSRPVTPGSTGGDDEPWLGSIRLPNSYRRRLAAEYEFIILSEAYNFSSDELGRQASQYIEPWSIVNVMLIKRVPKQLFTEEHWKSGHNHDIIAQAVCEVERVGVGRMLKDVWSDVESYEDFMLV